MFNKCRKEQMNQQMILPFSGCGGKKISLLRGPGKGIPGGPLGRTWHFHCCGLGLNPDWGTEILQAVWDEQKLLRKKVSDGEMKTVFNNAFPVV